MITDRVNVMFDSHAHVDTRPFEDFELLAISGVTDVLTLAHDPMRMSSSHVFKDHFDRVLSERQRALKGGIRLHVGLGLHPRARPGDLDACLELLEARLKAGEAVAVGEIGLEAADPFEATMFQRQVLLAIKYDLPIIAHTPKKGKAMVTREILHMLSTFTIAPGRVVVDHADADTVGPILDRSYNAGLTVQPGKLTPAAAVEIVKSHDISRLLLNTDMSSGPTDVLSIPKTAHALRLAGVKPEVTDAVSDRNARRVFLRESR